MSTELLALPLLAGIGAFALVGLIWNLAEAYFEERKEER
jgi:hypothetical protein